MKNSDKDKLEKEQEQRLIVIAKKEYKELVEIVSNYSGNSLSELCEMLCGHNLDFDLFDVNYGRICATVKQKEDGSFTVLNEIEIWNESEGLEFPDNYNSLYYKIV